LFLRRLELDARERRGCSPEVHKTPLETNR
jgi:hypothetical protein